jgi:hypothetical protein
MLQRRGLAAGDGLETASGKGFRPKLYRAGCSFSMELGPRISLVGLVTPCGEPTVLTGRLEAITTKYTKVHHKSNIYRS